MMHKCRVFLTVVEKKIFCLFKIVIPIYYNLKVKQIFSDFQKEKTTMTFELL
jgi:hypothetical protein